MSDADLLRRRLDDGPVLGTFVKLARAEVVTLLARCGMDLLVLDLEHSEASDADAREALVAARLARVPVVVRVDGPDRGRINRLLELGAAGIQLPRVAHADDVAQLVSLTRYPPAGTRSVSTTQAMGAYGGVGLHDLLAAAAASRPLLVAQIETAEVDDSLWDALAQVDVAFLGTTDLSVTAGTPGDLTVVAPLIRRLEEVAGACGVHLGVFAAEAGLEDHLARGYRMAVVGSDLDALATGTLQRRARFDDLVSRRALP